MVHQSAQYHMAVRWCIPPVNTVPHGGQMVHQSAQYHMAVRSCILPVNTVPNGGQIVHSASQHSTTWRSDRALHQSTQYHMAVRSCILPINTVPHGGQIVHSQSQSAQLQYHMTAVDTISGTRLRRPGEAFRRPLCYIGAWTRDNNNNKSIDCGPNVVRRDCSKCTLIYRCMDT